jgi:hypothetical protein
MGQAVRLALLERQVVAHSFFCEQAPDGNRRRFFAHRRNQA